MSAAMDLSIDYRDVLEIHPDEAWEELSRLLPIRTILVVPVVVSSRVGSVTHVMTHDRIHRKHPQGPVYVRSPGQVLCGNDNICRNGWSVDDSTYAYPTCSVCIDHVGKFFGR